MLASTSCTEGNIFHDGSDLAKSSVVATSNSVQSLTAPSSVFGTQATALQLEAGTPLRSIDIIENDATADERPLSRQSLLLRAAELGPQRLTLDNILMAPTDPILGAKMQPRVAERRARFRTIVKVALGSCVAFCLVATAATALSSSGPAASHASSSMSLHANAPSTGVVPVEKLEIVSRTKAPSAASQAAPVRSAAVRTTRAKRR